MAIGNLVPWRWGSLRSFDEDRSFDAFRAEMDSLHRSIDRLFGDAWGGSFAPSLLSETWTTGKITPRLDVVDDEKAFRVSVELPGMSDKDVAVTVDDRTLTIRGEKKEEKEKKDKDVFRRERAANPRQGGLTLSLRARVIRARSSSSRCCSTARRCSRTARSCRTAGCRTADAVDRMHELGDRTHAKLPHDPRSMQLDRALAHAEIHRDDLVRLPARDALHDLGLARRQQRDAGPNRILLGARLAPLAIALERLVDAVDEILVAERLLNEVGRSRLHRRHGHRHVTVPGNENDRDLGTLVVQTLLQLETAQPRHADVGDQARMPLGIVVLEKIERRRVRLVFQSDGLEQHAQRVANGFVVVDQIDERAVVFHACAGSRCSAGSSMLKIEPPAGLSE
jgi:HSP20 family molecular chaperone IbpA